jgi:lysophospholipase L1-like esterase
MRPIPLRPPSDFGFRPSFGFWIWVFGFLAFVFPLSPSPLAAAAAKPRIILVGDSTVTDNAGWGLGFKQLLSDQAECVNTAAGGRSSKSFIDEGRWKDALALKGDYYLIQFGHNDEPGKGLDRETEPRTTYREFMARYVDDARAAGAKPILVTSLTRRQWDSSGRINSSLVPYAEVVKALAREKHVPLVELHARSVALCEQLGRDKCYEFSPLKGTNQYDNTHLNAKGSLLFARLVVEELVRAVPELKACFRTELPAEPADRRPNPANPAHGAMFNVRDLGAKGDGQSLDTAAIQQALDRCGQAGGGVVRLPAGTYRSKPLTLRSQTTLQLDAGAKLLATDEPADFAGANPASFIPFIGGSRLTNVAIIGPGVVDGAGAKWWVPAEAARRKTPGYTLPRPNLIGLTRCHGLRVENITLQNSPKFHFVPSECEDVLVTNVTITAPAGSPNTDAIDPSACRHVLITHCRLDVGDDNVAIKAGRKVEGREFACEDITVRDCTFLHGHGMSIGSETSGGVRNVVVRDCTFENTENGLRIKSQRGRGGLVENVTYSNITMKNVDPAITFTCYYMNNSKGDPVQPAAPRPEPTPNSERIPLYRNIVVRNLQASCPDNTGVILGLPDSPIQNVTLDNVCITAARGLTIHNARAIQAEHSTIITREGPPALLENAQVEGLVARGTPPSK